MNDKKPTHYIVTDKMIKESSQIERCHLMIDILRGAKYVGKENNYGNR